MLGMIRMCITFVCRLVSPSYTDKVGRYVPYPTPKQHNLFVDFRGPDLGQLNTWQSFKNSCGIDKYFMQ
jgi:hypothetical protein